MPTRHRNSKSHKKSLRNKGQKGGALLEKDGKKISKIPDNIKDLDGATYTQNIMNKHSYKIRVFEKMTYDNFKTEVDFEIEISGKKTTFIGDINNRYSHKIKLLNKNNMLQINNKDITGFTLLWNFNNSKIKIDTPITISVPFYETPVNIKIDSDTKCILFNSNNIYKFSFSSILHTHSLDVQDAGGMIQSDKIVEYYKSQAFGIKTAIGTAIKQTSDFMETNKPFATVASGISERAQAVSSSIKHADLTGACNRCTYTFTDAEQKQVLALLGQSGGPFSANLSFAGDKLILNTTTASAAK